VMTLSIPTELNTRPSKNVEAGTAFFFTLQGIRMGDGWTATPIGKDTYHTASPATRKPAVSETFRRRYLEPPPTLSRHFE
jgi:hypothetical protein